MSSAVEASSWLAEHSEFVIGAIMAGVGGMVGWLVRLERRLFSPELNRQEIRHIRDTLERIERRQDATDAKIDSLASDGRADHAALRAAVQESREEQAALRAIVDGLRTPTGPRVSGRHGQ